MFALDVEQIDEAERFVKLLAPHVGMFKVGPRLFTGSGSLVIDLIHGLGSSVFLDLKFHDIPETVAGAAREVARQRVRLFTVHALGGAQMIRRACAELATMTLIPGIPQPQCIGVTILTSHSPDELVELGIDRPLSEQVERLAKLALGAGASGVVASGHELAGLRRVLPPETVYVVPGIRGRDDQRGDQARVMTAKEAVEAGATYVVVGRPIKLAKEPADEAKRIVDEIASANALD
ncbi:orotidine-5'-phosphate decarboxylase [Myxococcota bacterium]|nr:orotidine-5'-phosphate decarboxylase [Myxococcota bacterium]